MKEIAFDQLTRADLHVDALYKGGTYKNAKDDPIGRLIPGIGNQGGFRISGSAALQQCRYVVLYTSGVDADWPDQLDETSGQFTYFGDNKKPGHDLHDTPRKGNLLLRAAFEAMHRGDRTSVPPFFVFRKASQGRDVMFRGLAVPGASGLSATEDLVAVWKSKIGRRFQNYKAVFTILDVPVIQRSWIDELQRGGNAVEDCPRPWRNWVTTGVYAPLMAERSTEHRTKAEQLPEGRDANKIVQTIRDYFKENPYGFEKCAAELFRMSDRNVAQYDLTRPWRDGGRDALGQYRIGFQDNAILVEFALEAKCYQETRSVGVSETSRLISRLRHRQFGVLVTTSFVHEQAYREIKEDGHPVIVIAARDIANILRGSGLGDARSVTGWLQQHFQGNRPSSS